MIAGSALRPLGGHLADRFGGVRMLTGLYLVVGRDHARHGDTFRRSSPGRFCYLRPWRCWAWATGPCSSSSPNAFPREIGVTTGIVGAAGGFGGFLLPTVLGSLKQATGSFSGGFLAFAIAGGFGGAPGTCVREPRMAWCIHRERAEGPRKSVTARFPNLAEA